MIVNVAAEFLVRTNCRLSTGGGLFTAGDIDHLWLDDQWLALDDNTLIIMVDELVNDLFESWSITAFEWVIVHS